MNLLPLTLLLMKAKHWIKLSFAQRRWKKKRGQELTRFANRKHLYNELKEIEETLQEEFNSLARVQPTSNTGDETPLGRYHTAKGKLELVRELLYND